MAVAVRRTEGRVSDSRLKLGDCKGNEMARLWEQESAQGMEAGQPSLSCTEAPGHCQQHLHFPGTIQHSIWQLCLGGLRLLPPHLLGEQS